MSIEPAAVPLVGFRRWGCKRGALFSGIFVAGRFVPNPAVSMVAPRARPVPWPPGETRLAKCFALRGHEAPHRDCNCGIAAYYALDEEPELPAPEALWGAIVAWGRIVECERGFRAQFARPIALLDAINARDHVKPRVRAQADKAAEAYEIPLLARDELIAYAGWHGELRQPA